MPDEVTWTRCEPSCKTKMEDNCVTYQKPVEDDDKALECDFYNQWEHLNFVRQRERSTEGLYQELLYCHLKSVLHVCSCCHWKGSMPQRIYQLEEERARVGESRLASTFI